MLESKDGPRRSRRGTRRGRENRRRLSQRRRRGVPATAWTVACLVVPGGYFARRLEVFPARIGPQLRQRSPPAAPAGAHLSVVPADTPSSPPRRRSLRGSRAHLGPDPSWEDFEAASEVATRDHEARYGPGGRWDPSTSAL